MNITLLLHFEKTDDGFCWWAESEQVPGFTAAAETLMDLRTIYREALDLIASEDGFAIGDITETYASPAKILIWTGDSVQFENAIRIMGSPAPMDVLYSPPPQLVSSR